MKYLNRLLFLCLLFGFSLVSHGLRPFSNPYKIDFYNGYVVDLYFTKSGCYPLMLSVMVDNCDFANACKNQTVNETLKWFVNNSYVFPLQIFSDRIMFEQLCGELNNELMNKILNYQANYTKQSSYYCKTGKIKLRDGYKLNYCYSKYSGIIFVPLEGNEFYNSNCSESINFKDYPDVKIAMPIFSGYSR